MKNLHKTQSVVASDLHRFRVVNAGRRWGKTELSVEEMKGFAVAKEAGNIGYIASTFAQARDIAWEKLKASTRALWDDKPNESRLEVNIRNQFYNDRRPEIITNSGTIIPWLSRIVLRGWEAVESFRGQAFDFLVPDEIAMYRSFWPQWQEVLRPTLTDRRGHALFISTPKGFNHFHDLYNLQDTDPDYKSFHFTTYDNPFIPVDEIDKARKELTEDRFAQEYLADFRKTEGLVYKEFDRNEHVFDEPGFEGEDFVVVKTFGGVDFGFTNPAAVYTILKDKDANYWIPDEFYQTQRTDAQIADYVAALKWNEAYPDPESASGCEELRRRKVNVRDVIKNKDSVRNGINAVRELFKANRLYIHRSCINLIWELETYSYPGKKPDHNEQENPIKENDHALDAIRYALSMEGNTKGSSVKVNRQKYSGYNRT